MMENFSTSWFGAIVKESHVEDNVKFLKIFFIIYFFSNKKGNNLRNQFDKLQNQGYFHYSPQKLLRNSAFS